ncbi:hypothetical protein, partial [Streptomyces sp. SPB074]|uniref:hypothetical protein n=1 Tax=Streptomyces sp. (strain SPB074) TaxID=465543 RepID=UPI001F1864E6
MTAVLRVVTAPAVLVVLLLALVLVLLLPHGPAHAVGPVACQPSCGTGSPSPAGPADGLTLPLTGYEASRTTTPAPAPPPE